MDFIIPTGMGISNRDIAEVEFLERFRELAEHRVAGEGMVLQLVGSEGKDFETGNFGVRDIVGATDAVGSEGYLRQAWIRPLCPSCGGQANKNPW